MPLRESITTLVSVHDGVPVSRPSRRWMLVPVLPWFCIAAHQVPLAYQTLCWVLVAVGASGSEDSVPLTCSCTWPLKPTLATACATVGTATTRLAARAPVTPSAAETLAERGALAEFKGAGFVEARLRAEREFLIQANDHAAEQVLDAGLVFADDDMLAEHRDSTMKLLIAVVLRSVGIDGLFKQPQFRRCIQTQHFRVTFRRFGNEADVRCDLRILQVDRLDVLLVQVRTLGGHRRTGRNGQRKRRERGETTNHRLMREIAHCTIPL